MCCHGRTWSYLALGLALVLGGTGCPSTDDHKDGHEHGDASASAGTAEGGSHEHGGDAHGGGDHHAAAKVPPEYAGKKNPLAGDAAAATDGGKIYAEQCADCHGAKGAGDGEHGGGLDPKPTNFTDGEHMKQMADDYLYWRVSEGGKGNPVKSKMPAWKDELSEQDRWKAITFLRTLAH